MRHLLLIIHQVAAIIAVGYVWMGHEYMTVGYGIHPIIAGACALSLIVLPHCIVALDHRRREMRRRQEAVNHDWTRLHPLK